MSKVKHRKVEVYEIDDQYEDDESYEDYYPNPPVNTD